MFLGLMTVKNTEKTERVAVNILSVCVCMCACVFITVVRKKRKNHHDLLKYNINELITLVTVSLNLDSFLPLTLVSLTLPMFAMFSNTYIKRYTAQNKLHNS